MELLLQSVESFFEAIGPWNTLLVYLGVSFLIFIIALLINIKTSPEANGKDEIIWEKWTYWQEFWNSNSETLMLFFGIVSLNLVGMLVILKILS